MQNRLLKLVAESLSRVAVSHAPAHTFSAEEVLGAMGSFCANCKLLDAGLLIKQIPLPYHSNSFIHTSRVVLRDGYTSLHFKQSRHIELHATK